MLKFENVANVGDVIKAFDFQPMEGRDDSYLIGEVIEKGPMYMEMGEHAWGNKVHVCNGYKVLVKDSRSGSESYDINRMGTEIIVPFEMSITEFDNRVEVIA